MKNKFKPGDIVFVKETVFNLTAGDRHEVDFVGALGGVFLKNFENIDGGFGECRFYSESELWAESVLNELEVNIRAFEQLEKDVKQWSFPRFRTE